MLYFLHELSLISPLLFSGIILIFCLKRHIFKILHYPLDHRVSFHNKRLLGEGKTYLGLLMHIGGATIWCFILHICLQYNPYFPIHAVFAFSPLTLGLLYGCSYLAGEIVNSFIKRSLGIPQGERGKRFYGVQQFFDLADGILVTGMMLLVLKYLSFYDALYAVLLGIFFHIMTDMSMYYLHLKNR